MSFFILYFIIPFGVLFLETKEEQNELLPQLVNRDIFMNMAVTIKDTFPPRNDFMF